MKLSKLLPFALGMLGAISMSGCGNTITPNEPEPEPLIQLDEEETAVAPRKNLTISTNASISSYIKDMDFDSGKIWSFDITGSVKPQPSKSGNMTGGRLMITKKEIRNAKSGTASLHSLNLSSLLYPGQLLKANSKLVEGVPTAITDLDRGKTTYRISLPGFADNTFSVDETTAPLYRSKLNAKLAEWKGLGQQISATQTYNLTQVYDSTQLSVDMGFGLGEKLKIGATYKQGGSTNLYVAAFEQVFYTVDVVVNPDNSTVIFDDQTTLDEVQREIKSDAPPLLVTKAYYGQTVYLKVETSLSKKEVEAGFQYAGLVDVSAKTKFQQTLNRCKINCLVYGGSAEDSQEMAPIEGSGSADTINQILSKSKAPAADQVEHAVLLKYETSWLKNGTAARIQSTSQYLETSYEFRNGFTFYLHNRGAFVVKTWLVCAYRLTGYDSNGNPTFGGLEQLYRDTSIITGQDRSVYIPANYGRVRFAYDVRWGSDWPFDGRISDNDFNSFASVTLYGTTYGSYGRFMVDGRTWET